jgi:hypothetical protein
MKQSILQNARNNYYKPYGFKHVVPSFWYKPFYIITYETDNIFVVDKKANAVAISNNLNELYNAAILLEEDNVCENKCFMKNAITPPMIKHSHLYNISFDRISKNIFGSTYNIKIKNNIMTKVLKVVKGRKAARKYMNLFCNALNMGRTFYHILNH